MYRLFTLLISILFFSACNSKMDEITDGEGNVRIHLDGIEYIDDTVGDEKKSSSQERSSLASSDVQEKIIPIDEHSAVIATVERERPNVVESQRNTVSGEGGKSAAAVNKKEAVANGVRYRVLVYSNATGNLVTNNEYVHSTSSRSPSFRLDAGNYTVILYSYNTAATIPGSPAIGSPLASANITNVPKSSALLYFRGTLNVVANGGSNNLNAVLRHQFNVVKVKLFANSESGIALRVHEAFDLRVKPSYASASLKLSNGVLTYNDVEAAGALVDFSSTIPDAGVDTASSTLPLMLVGGNTTGTGEISIGSVRIHQFYNPVNLTLTGLTFQPGYNYTVKLKFIAPCLQLVRSTTGSDLFNTPSTTTDPYSGGPRVMDFSSASYGFTFDFYGLDNSFNMRFGAAAPGGTPLITNPTGGTSPELQFQSGVSGHPRNVRFADGTEFGATGSSEIYNMHPGLPSNANFEAGKFGRPMLRVRILSNGQVRLYGTKVSGGRLLPLTLYNGSIFNTISWATSGTQTVRFSQHHQSPTEVLARGYGLRVVPCPGEPQ